MEENNTDFNDVKSMIDALKGENFGNEGQRKKFLSIIAGLVDSSDRQARKAIQAMGSFMTNYAAASLEETFEADKLVLKNFLEAEEKDDKKDDKDKKPDEKKEENPEKKKDEDKPDEKKDDKEGKPDKKDKKEESRPRYVSRFKSDSE